MTPELLLANVGRDDTVSNYIVMLLRLITSAEIQKRSDFFEPFIMVSGAQRVVGISLTAIWNRGGAGAAATQIARGMLN